MLVGLSGYLAGYNGSFEFKSGEKYPEDVNYTFMRLFNSTFGALCIPLAYFTARELNLRRPAVWLVTMMVLFENSYATISRFILLDSMLLFFTFTTVLCWARFHRLREDPFSMEWFLWLYLSGLSIGCVCSVKWVGLFCTALVGIYTAEDLWNKFGDLKMPVVSRMSLPAILELTGVDYSRTARCRSSGRIDNHTFPCLCLFILHPLSCPRKFWSWRRADELSVPGQS